MPWVQFIITSFLGGQNVLIIRQPNKMVRDLRNSNGRTELSATSMKTLVSGVDQKCF